MIEIALALASKTRKEGRGEGIALFLPSSPVLSFGYRCRSEHGGVHVSETTC